MSVLTSRTFVDGFLPCTSTTQPIDACHRRRLRRQFQVLVAYAIVHISLSVPSTVLANILSLTVDQDTGEIFIENSALFSTDPIVIDAYGIDSPSGSLNFSGWMTLKSQELDKIGDGPGEQWEPGGAADNFFLGEFFFLGSSQFDVGEIVSLGFAYNLSSPIQDLTFQYGGPGIPATDGIVQYVGLPSDPLAGNYNGDFIVDALDAGIWAGTLGSETFLIADGNFNGIVGPEDYEIIVDTLGANFGGLPLDPTPAALIYNRSTGEVILDQSRAEEGIITAFFLNESTGGLLAPGNANFPYESPIVGGPFSVPTEFAGPQRIGQIDVNAAGLPSTRFSLGNVLPAGLSLAELSSALASSYYMPAPGYGPSAFQLVAIPEPSKCYLTLIGLAVIGIVYRRAT